MIVTTSMGAAGIALILAGALCVWRLDLRLQAGTLQQSAFGWVASVAAVTVCLCGVAMVSVCGIAWADVALQAIAREVRP